jgi:hypothetical protein
MHALTIGDQLTLYDGGKVVIIIAFLQRPEESNLSMLVVDSKDMLDAKVPISDISDVAFIVDVFNGKDVTFENHHRYIFSDDDYQIFVRQRLADLDKHFRSGEDCLTSFWKMLSTFIDSTSTELTQVLYPSITYTTIAYLLALFIYYRMGTNYLKS